MALEGTLKDVSLPDILQLLAMQKKTGVLSISRGKEMVTACFDKGQLVFADEFQRSEQERLGAILLKSKLLAPQQLLKAAEMQKQTLQKLGYILVTNNFISQNQLKEALQTQVKETVFKLFRWEEGIFKFSQEPVSYDRTIYHPIHTDFMVMEGIRRIDEWPVIKKKIHSMDIIFDRAEGAEGKVEEAEAKEGEEDLDNILSFVDDGGLGSAPPDEGQGVRLSSTEKVVFSLVDGHRTIEELADEGRLGEFDTCKALFSLVSLNLIKEVGRARPPEAEEEPEKAPFLLKKKLMPLGLSAALIIIFMGNPLGLPRVWPEGKEAAIAVARISDHFKLEKVKFALLCYFLEKQAYPPNLIGLVEARMMAESDIVDHEGNEFFYLRERDGYSLRASAGLEKEGEKKE